MAPGLLIPVVMLLAVPVVALLVLRRDGSGRRLETRIEAVVGTTPIDTADAPAPKLRLAETRSGSVMAALRKLVQLPEHLPEARKYPLPVVLAVAAALGAAAWGFTQLYFAAWVGLPIGIVVALLVLRQALVSEAANYAKRLRKQMPDMIELVVSATLAGLPVSEGFVGVAREITSPTREEFQRVTRDIALGVTIDEAMMRLFRRTQVPEYAIFAVTLGVQSRSGGKLSEVIMRLADTIRQRIAIADRAGALAAEAKLSAYVLSVLPFIGALLMAIMQPGFLGPLVNDPRGHHLIFYGGVALICGWITMKKMINNATSE